MLHGNRAGSPVFARCPNRNDNCSLAMLLSQHRNSGEVFWFWHACSGFYKPAEGPLVKALNQETGNIGLNRSLITDLIHRRRGGITGYDTHLAATDSFAFYGDTFQERAAVTADDAFNHRERNMLGVNLALLSEICCLHFFFPLCICRGCLWLIRLCRNAHIGSSYCRFEMCKYVTHRWPLKMRCSSC